MNISNLKGNIDGSSRTSAKKAENKSTSARTKEKSSMDTGKSVQMNK